MKRVTCVSLGIALGMLAGVMFMTQAEAAPSCDALKNASFKDTKIEIAADVRPGPGWGYPPSSFNDNAATDPTGAPDVQVPFCRVVATIETEIKFELWLPVNWNGRYQQVGNGGYTGAINYPTMGGALAKGFATASSDLGHVSKNSFDATWMVGHKQRVIDFGYRAHHLVSVISKEIIKAYYGHEVDHSYFVGCSSGGWQGLTEIQKFPEDFDGVVAGAPAHNFVRLNVRDAIAAQMSLRNPEGNLTSVQTKLVGAAALKKCDAKDGAVDGLISDPAHCDFDPKELQCKAGEKSDSCLTPAQVTRVRALYGPITSKGGMQLYPGATYAATLDLWAPLKAGDPAFNRPLANALREFGYTDIPTVATFNPDKDLPPVDKVIGPVMSSMDPDISKFKARGGKVIVWHGWSDQRISPFNTLLYYRSVEKELGGNLDDFYRMFFLPGVGHCGAGSTGPSAFDPVTPLVQWVESGIVPTRIEATQYKGGKVMRSRPLCVYPEYAKYNGSGDVNDGENFSCVKP